MTDPVYIECQTCGKRLYGPLHEVELQMLTEFPERFVIDCTTCFEQLAGQGA